MAENKINVTEIVEKIKKGVKNPFGGVEVKQFLPIRVKSLICEEIANQSIVEKDGMKILDLITYELALDLYLVTYYTNVEIGEEYDVACEFGILDMLKQQMNPKEIEFIEKHSMHLIESEISTYNSVGGVLHRNLQELISKLPTDKQIKSIIKTASKELQKFDPNKLKQVQELSRLVRP